MPHFRIIRLAFSVLLIALLGGCGGGGGGSGNSPPAPSRLSYPAAPAFEVGHAIISLSPTVTGTVSATAPAAPSRELPRQVQRPRTTRSRPAILLAPL